MKRGPKPTSTEEKSRIIQEVCGLIIQSSVKKACEQVGIDDSTFFAWLASDEELASEYMRARKAIAFKDEVQVETIAGEVKDGQMDPSAARVAIDAHKWLAGKRNAPVYGDKIQHAGDGGGAIKIETNNLGMLSDDKIQRMMDIAKEDNED